MAVYVYETTDETKPVRQFEIVESMKEAPLAVHPETGEAIRRVITGDLGYMAKGNEGKQQPIPAWAGMLGAER